ncbi:MAG TPA: hypothetical protein VNF03_12695 [Patescibacteria group bacterium]|nr:hypothetical protein [Patescibacteria group bacterium]
MAAETIASLTVYSGAPNWIPCCASSRVTVAEAGVPIVRPTGVCSITRKDSSPSAMPSEIVETVICFETSLGPNVTVPEAGK